MKEYPIILGRYTRYLTKPHGTQNHSGQLAEMVKALSELPRRSNKLDKMERSKKLKWVKYTVGKLWGKLIFMENDPPR